MPILIDHSSISCWSLETIFWTKLKKFYKKKDTSNKPRSVKLQTRFMVQFQSSYIFHTLGLDDGEWLKYQSCESLEREVYSE